MPESQHQVLEDLIEVSLERGLIEQCRSGEGDVFQVRRDGASFKLSAEQLRIFLETLLREEE